MSVAIFIVTHDNPIETAYFLDTLFTETAYDFRLYIYDFYNGNEDMKNMLITATNKSKGQYIQLNKFDSKEFKQMSDLKGNISLAHIYNSMLSKMTEDYGVFLSINFLVSKGWLKDLVYYNTSIKNSGCSSIGHTFKNIALTSALFEDETKSEPVMKTIWVNATNTFNEFVFFSKDTYEKQKIGLVDTTFEIKGHELSEWSFRFLNKGLCNYYISHNSAIKYKIENDILFPAVTDVGKKELIKKINEKSKNSNQINGII